MARIPDDLVARLKAEVSVQRLVEGVGVELRAQGADLVGRCPFHDDRTPSLVVTPGKNLWHCLGACQTGGSVVDWVMVAQGVSFRHAVELLQQQALALSSLASRSPLSSSGRVRRSTAPKLEPLAAPDAEDVELLGRVVGFYADTLTESPAAVEYLHRRRIADPESLQTFRLGFANRTLGYRLPHARTVAGAQLRSRLQTLGILRSSGHEHFRGCFVVPVLDERGQVGEVYGRRLNADGAGSRHLYLPGPHRGVWNVAAFGAVDELVVCESLIDALTLWCAGFRQVTAAYGADGWTGEHQQAVLEHGIKRVLIAFDADAAGDAGAKALAGELAPLGVECARVVLPRGADVNEVAVEATDPGGVFGRLLRTAEPMGPADGSRGMFRPGSPSAAPGAVGSPPAPVTPPPPDVEEARSRGKVSERELVLTFGDRRWRVRGLEKATSFDLLRVNLLVSGSGSRFHVDTLDLYSARARSVFLAQAAAELEVAPEVIKSDLGRVLLACEVRAEEVITAAQAPAKAEVTVTGAAREAALRLLTDPNLIGRIEADFATVGMVGEATNCLVGYLAAVSRLLPAPLAVLIQSTSAAGKSAVMEAVLAFVPGEDRVSFSAMTGQSLFYLGETDLAHKVLSIAEEEGAQRAAYALKLLQSEGELSIASTGKDTASGRLVTHTYKVTGPTAIVLTTTAIDVDEELLNRCLVLTVDEDRAQTQAIHTAQRRAQTLAGLAGRAERDRVVNLHRDAQRLLEPLAVVNPYADALTFADGRTRTRRDHGKYLGLIAAVTLLHQHQRPRKTTVLGGAQVTYVETTVADIEVANRLAHAVLGHSLDELPPQTRRLLQAIHVFVTADAQRLGVDVGLVRFTRRQLREHTGWGDTQLKVHLARLADLELLICHRAEAGGFGYELAWRGEGTAGQPFLAGLTDPAALRNGKVNQPVAPPATAGVTHPDTGVTHGYDADRSGSVTTQSGAGRPPVGGRSGPGRPELSPFQPNDPGASEQAAVKITANGTDTGHDLDTVVHVGGLR